MSDYVFNGQVSNKVFNTLKSDYQDSPLFYGEERGLLDTINIKYPRLFQLFEELKGMDWKHNEYQYSECLKDFQRVDIHTRTKMIHTLAWQWEADSIAGSSVIETLGPVITNTELRVAYTRLADNENLHAMTYSEITRGSFDNPGEIIHEITNIREALGRLSVVSEVFDKAFTSIYQYKLGLIPYSQDLYDKTLLVVVAIYCLERIQFMCSFAVTFGICSTGVFTNIGLAVQLIARDEFSNHVPLQEEVLRIELNTDRGQVFYKKHKSTILNIIKSIVKYETIGIEYLYKDGKDIVGITKQRLIDWLLFNTTAPITFFNLRDDFTKDYKLVESNPLPFMEKWIDMDASQQSNQEQDNNQYTANAVSTTALDDDFTLDL